MAAENPATRQAILDKLARSREEVRQILDPPRNELGANGGPPASDGSFPRSRTMRALLSNKGIGAVGALASGLLIARPSLALKMLRLVPVSAVGKMLLTKAIAGMRARRD
jgi:hypothetical protein